MAASRCPFARELRHGVGSLILRRERAGRSPGRLSPRTASFVVMRDSDWPPRCRHCDGPIGLHKLVGVVDGEGFVVAATALELRADPHRYRGRAVHLACVQVVSASAAPVLQKPVSC